MPWSIDVMVRGYTELVGDVQEISRSSAQKKVSDVARALQALKVSLSTLDRFVVRQAHMHAQMLIQLLAKLAAASQSALQLAGFCSCFACWAESLVRGVPDLSTAQYRLDP